MSLRILLFVVPALGCSALVNPDEADLGGAPPGTDAGPGRIDAGPGDPDGGMPGDDSGPIERDGGPERCTAPPSCAGSTLTFCEDGRERTERCTVGCADGEPRCAQMVPSNVSDDLWLEDARDVDVGGASVFSFDTTTCRSSTASSEVVRQGADGAPEVCVLSVGELRIAPGTVLSVTGSRPLVIMATGLVRIEGNVDVSATLDEPGPGGGRGGIGSPGGEDGAGPSGGAAGDHVGSFDDGGGGGGGLCGVGGFGGLGGGARGGRGGAQVTGWDLSPLVGGSGGGRGRGSFFSSGTNAGLGGAGGGAIQISSPVGILVTGQVIAGGGGGLSGKNLFGGSANWGSGGGGGSGGAILLEAPEISLGGASAIRAPGGGAGGGASSGGSGQDGQDGRAAGLGRATGGDPGSGGYGGRGGASGGAATVRGANGGAVARSSGNGGGGGGSAGCVLFRTADAATVSGTFNPSVEPGVRTLPVLRR